MQAQSKVYAGMAGLGRFIDVDYDGLEGYLVGIVAEELRLRTEPPDQVAYPSPPAAVAPQIAALQALIEQRRAVLVEAANLQTAEQEKLKVVKRQAKELEQARKLAATAGDVVTQRQLEDRLEETAAVAIESGEKAVRYAKLRALGKVLVNNNKAQVALAAVHSQAKRQGQPEAAAVLEQSFEALGQTNAELLAVREEQKAVWRAETIESEVERKRARLSTLQAEAQSKPVPADDSERRQELALDINALKNQLEVARREVAKVKSMAAQMRPAGMDGCAGCGLGDFGADSSKNEEPAAKGDKNSDKGWLERAWDYISGGELQEDLEAVEEAVNSLRELKGDDAVKNDAATNEAAKVVVGSNIGKVVDDFFGKVAAVAEARQKGQPYRPPTDSSSSSSPPPPEDEPIVEPRKILGFTPKQLAIGSMMGVGVVALIRARGDR